MASTAETVLSADLETQVDQIISKAGLRRPENEFFRRAAAVQEVSPEAGLAIARRWQLVTKTFMLTTIAGLGAMARRMNSTQSPDREVLAAFQTAYRVIGDDLCNFAPEFSAVSPEGPDGIHYLWWADTITAPLIAILPQAAEHEETLPSGISGLLANMTALADHPIGAAVQLRVVESIALDIAVAFRRIFAKITSAGHKVFPTAESLSWIDSHIRAETGHAKSVSDDETGMTAMAGNDTDQADLLAMIEEYARHWSRALFDFSGNLTV